MTSAQIDTIQALENENKILADEVKMKEDLIPGMEKMIAYLQKIQEENKRLKEEWVDPATVVQWEQAQVWLEENKRLKEENKILRKCNETYEDLLAGEKGLIDKNEELKEEINLTNTALDMVKDENEVNKKNLMKAMETIKEVINTAMEAKGEKQQEIDELKEENKILRQGNETYEDLLAGEKGLIDKNEELKEEMKEYKDYYEKWSEILSEVDGDDFCNLLQDCGWEENDEGELVRVTDK